MRNTVITSLVLLLLSGFLSSHASAAERIKITIYGDEGYFPYSYVENNQLKGIYVDIVKAAQAYMPEYEIEILPIPWKRGLQNLEIGKILALFPPYEIKGRPYIELSHPLLVEDVILFCLPKSIKTLNAKFPKDFKDLRIGINAGYALSDSFVEARNNKLINAEEERDTETNIRKLSKNRIDCYANDRFSTLYTIKKMQADATSASDIKNLTLVEVAEISKKSSFIGYSKKWDVPYKKDFIAKMNSAIDKLRNSGQIEAIVNKK